MSVAPDPPAWLVPFLRCPERAGVLTDFDGTLSPIVDDPEGAGPLPGAVDLMGGLARRYARVGVVSGRPVAFLRRHFGAGGVVLSGLYGLERAGPGEATVEHPDAAAWRPVVEEVAVRTETAGPGLHVERKGLSVTLHYRTDPGKEAAARSWAEAEAARTGLAVHAGRKSYELAPPLGRDKGTATLELADGLEAVCFVGDDRGDLAAFDALDRLAAEGAATVRVAVRSPEASAELLARADEVVGGPPGALEFLRRLLPSPPDFGTVFPSMTRKTVPKSGEPRR